MNIYTRYETYTGALIGNAQYGIYVDNCSAEGKIIVETLRALPAPADL